MMRLKIVVYLTLVITVDLTRSANIVNVTNEKSNKLNIDMEDCTEKICIRKCCAFGQAIYMGNYKPDCDTYDTPFIYPPIWSNDGVLLRVNTSDYVHTIIDNAFVCDKELNETKIFSNEDFRHYLLKNGSLMIIKTSLEQEVIPPTKYCLDDIIIRNKPVLVAAYCMTPLEPSKVILYTLNSICMLISCFFILLTVVVHIWLPELRNAKGCMVIATLLNFFVFFMCIASLNLMESYSRETCIVLTFVIYFSFLSAFFWMSVMSYDVWRKLRLKISVRESPAQIRRRFLKYCPIGFGGPGLLCVMLAVLEYVEMPFSVPVKPNLDHQVCFLSGRVKFYYLYVPIMILYIPNTIFFIWTTIILIRQQKINEQFLRRPGSNTHNGNKQYYWLCVNLFTLIGFTWILEVVSYLYPEKYYIWWFIDAYNALVGLVIFILIVCKKGTWKIIVKRYKLATGLPIVSGNKTTSTVVRSTLTSSIEEDILKESNSRQREP